jgi:hypothetical protein
VICNLGVVGSNPTRGSKEKRYVLQRMYLFFLFVFCKKSDSFAL